MRGGGGQGHRLAVLINDRHHGNVRQMSRALGVRQVGDVHRPRLHPIDRKLLQHRPQYTRHDPQVQWGTDFGLSEHFAVDQGHGGRTVAAIFDIGRVAGADQRRAHFFGHGSPAVPHDLQCDRIDNGAHGMGPSSNWPCGSTCSDWPGQRRVVESSCSITAGPSRRSPTPKPSRP